MNYGIGNVKAKSSGGVSGGIPVITLEASQMVDSTHIQFTEEQYNTIVNNGAFYLDILGSQQLLMTCVNASNLADIQCYNISQTGSGLQLATIDLNKTTYIGVLGISPYPQAKQLYQHNVRLTDDSTRYFRSIYIAIPSEKETALTIDDIKDFLVNNGYVSSSSGYQYMQKMYKMWGYEYDRNNTSNIVVWEAINHYNNYTFNCFRTANLSSPSQIDLSNYTFEDTIIAL